MRSGVHVRAVAAAVLVLVLACCSSLCSVVAFNDSDRPIALKVSAPHGQGWEGRLEPGASVDVWSGFRGPGAMTFIVDGKKLDYTPETLPPGFARAGSGGSVVHWRWTGRDARFEIAVRNKLSRWMNQMMGLGCICFAMFALAVRWAITSAQTKLAENREMREPHR